MSAEMSAEPGPARTITAWLRAFLLRRLAELTGAAAMAIAVAATLALFTYDPQDPSLLHASDRAPTNLLGASGSAMADPVLRAVGAAGLFLPVALFFWGGRRMLHAGRSRTPFLALYLPPAILLATPGLAMLTPPGAWPLPNGLGGVIGDRFLASIGGWAVAARDWLDPTIGSRLQSAGFMLAALLCLTVACGLDGRAMLRLLRGPVLLLVMLLEEILRLAIGMATGGPRLLRRLRARLTGAGPARAPRQRRGALHRAWSTAVGRLPDLPRLPRLPRLPHLPNLSRLPLRFRLPRLPRLPDWVRHDPTLEPMDPVHVGMPARLEPTLGGATTEPMPRPAPPPAPPRAPPSSRRPAAAEPEPEPRRPPTRSRGKQQGPPPAPTGNGYAPPPVEFLAGDRGLSLVPVEMDVEETASALEAVLADYRIGGEIRNALAGPAVTLFELDPPPGLKASRLEGLADDIARSMGVVSARIATVPGSKMIGIEIPNPDRKTVLLRELFESDRYRRGKGFLPLALGMNILGDPVIADLEKMPHLLVAGTTGSGKSVAINAMILSLLYRLPPEDCRMILIDPKMLEFSVYDDIPHLLTPVVTDPQTAVLALNWVVGEMENRYRLMSQLGVRNIANFNARLAKAAREGRPVTREVQRGVDPATGEAIRERVELGIDHLPRIVVVVDEMADLMMVAGKEIEACVQRLAQMARASGIHLIMATQRPSVDVITGTIKANFPTRISFRLSSKIDSRTILNEQGAEKLLGQGDMLYQAAGARVTRIHGPFVSEEEIEQIVGYLHDLGPPDYVPDVTLPRDDALALPGPGGESRGESIGLVEQAIEIIARDRKASTSYLQRKLGIGYNRAASVMEELEAMGAVSSPDHVGKRQILLGDGP